MKLWPARRVPYLIAEVGVNHDNDLARAHALIRLAAAAGADAVKFQAYRSHLLAAAYAPAYWDTTKTPETSQRALFDQHPAFTVAEYTALARTCAACGVDFLVTAFDTELVDALDPLVPAWKVASADLTNRPYLAHIARKGKPVLLSTGAANLGEITGAVAFLRTHGAPVVIVLHCVLTYPCSPAAANLRAIRTLETVGADAVGYSDHVPANWYIVPLAYVLGATVIEKHFTDDITRPGNDHHHAWDGESLRAARGTCREITPALGTGNRLTVPAHELPARRHARRSWHAARDLVPGDILTPGDVVALRPGHGVPPDTDLTGYRVVQPVPAGQVIVWADVTTTVASGAGIR